jgi:fructoselysine-6-P-deglycase FrlB-like protein
VSGPGRAVWSLGAAPDGLPGEVGATGAHFEAGSLEPMAELVRAQRVAVARAEAAGLDPDAPRHLTRSVVLEG